MLWICQSCTTAYSVGAPRCPHCGCEEYEENMAKISVHGGATDKTLPVVETEPEAVEVEAEAAVEVAEVEIVVPDVVAEVVAPPVAEPRTRRGRTAPTEEPTA